MHGILMRWIKKKSCKKTNILFFKWGPWVPLPVSIFGKLLNMYNLMQIFENFRLRRILMIILKITKLVNFFVFHL